jgi:hypothetical protein
VAKKIFESRPEVGIEVGSGMARRWGEWFTRSESEEIDAKDEYVIEKIGRLSERRPRFLEHRGAKE